MQTLIKRSAKKKRKKKKKKKKRNFETLRSLLSNYNLPYPHLDPEQGKKIDLKLVFL